MILTKCTAPGCAIEGPHQHVESLAQTHAGYERGIVESAALELLQGRGWVSRKKVRAAILEQLERIPGRVKR